MSGRGLAGVLLTAVVVSLIGVQPAGAAAPSPGIVSVQVTPALSGVHLTVGGVAVTTGADGAAQATVADLVDIQHDVVLTTSHWDGDATVAIRGVRADPPTIPHQRSLKIGLNITSPVSVALVAGTQQTPPRAVTSIRLHSSAGTVIDLRRTTDGHWPQVNLDSIRTVRRGDGFASVPVSWTVDSVMSTGGHTVSARRVPFRPFGHPTWRIHLTAVPGTVVISTVPKLAGVQLTVAGQPATTDADGSAVVTVPDLNNVVAETQLRDQQVEASGSPPPAVVDGSPPSTAATPTTVDIRRIATLPPGAPHQRRLLVALNVTRAVSLAFVDSAGIPVPTGSLTQVTLRASGLETVLSGDQLDRPVPLLASTTSQQGGTWRSRPVTYSVVSVIIDGENAVFTGRQSFQPDSAADVTIHLAVFTTSIQLRDALFGTTVPSAVTLTAEDGTSWKATTGANATVTFPATVRGGYQVTVHAAAVDEEYRLRISATALSEIRIITPRDVITVVAAAAILVVGLIALGWYLGQQPRHGPHRGRVATAIRRRWLPVAGIVVAGLALAAAVVQLSPASSVGAAEAPPSSAAPHGKPAAHPAQAGVPVYAYFYQWFTEKSWSRAKDDFPLAGRYSSADPDVLRTQIHQAQQAGIDGFFTSWKDTPQLNANLDMLIREATAANFDLGVVYQALDFHRKPLPIATVRADMVTLVDRWGDELTSRRFGKPVIIWTGTSEFTPAEVASVRDALAGRALLLAAAKSVDAYNALADNVDGNAYYWSSADPTSPTTAAKLRAMGDAVHAHGGIWLAPAAPGFDGRTLGHTRVIPRDDGKTLTASLDDAYASSPDAVGVISWNEWSENTYIEPGERYGAQDLDVLRADLASRRAGQGSADSSAAPAMAAAPVVAPGTPRPARQAGPVSHGSTWWWPVLVTVIALAAGAAVAVSVSLRQRRT